MKQDLWLANSSLLLIFALVLIAQELLQQEVPSWKPPKALLSSIEKKKEELTTPAQTWEKIYQDDIFGTYTPTEVKAEKVSLITPIPEPRTPILPPPPEPKKQEFIPQLSITLRGIIAGHDEARNVAMVSDETNKEGLYHLGEKIKDGQIVKIAHNRIVVLRANGQQEIFYLRKDELTKELEPAEKWKYIVKPLDAQSYVVDPFAFTKEVESLGAFIEQAGVVGTSFQSGKPLGIRIGKNDKSMVASSLGLMENDIIISVNDLDVADTKNRIKAYDSIVQSSLGSSIKVTIRRADKDVSLLYKLDKIDRPRKSTFPGISMAAPLAQTPAQEPFKLNRLQQREQTMRDFDRLHPTDQQRQQTIMDIRRRILENLQRRFQTNQSH